MAKATLRSGVTLHYQQTGQGPDVVMIHGLTGNLAVWHLQIIPVLWDHFRITTYDLRGHGYSEVTPSGYSADDMADDLLDLLDELEIERPALVGHSFGADVALYFALKYPERVAQVVGIEAALAAMIYLRERDDWEGWDYWTDVLERSGFSVPPERRSDVDYLLRMSLQVPKKWGPLNGLPRNPRPYLRLLDETSIATDSMRVGSLTLERIPEIATPVTLIYSDGSAFVGTYHYLLEHLPNTRGVLLPRTEWGHFGPLEQPEEIAVQIRDALADPVQPG
ncbi:MAG TPA: alpha/beta hydrolase [Thermomicrobiaceae bacterium]|nr:alpha/beta hydrolase [Thermomicrobiaceae bacterium]